MLVYHWKEHDMSLTFTNTTGLRPVVELALGREVRILQLEEFTDFILTIIEEGRKSTAAYMKSLEELQRERSMKKGKPISPTCT